MREQNKVNHYLTYLGFISACFSFLASIAYAANELLYIYARHSLSVYLKREGLDTLYYQEAINQLSVRFPNVAPIILSTSLLIFLGLVFISKYDKNELINTNSVVKYTYIIFVYFGLSLALLWACASSIDTSYSSLGIIMGLQDSFFMVYFCFFCAITLIQFILVKSSLTIPLSLKLFQKGFAVSIITATQLYIAQWLFISPKLITPEYLIVLAICNVIIFTIVSGPACQLSLNKSSAGTLAVLILINLLVSTVYPLYSSFSRVNITYRIGGYSAYIVPIIKGNVEEAYRDNVLSNRKCFYSPEIHVFNAIILLNLDKKVFIDCKNNTPLGGLWIGKDQIRVIPYNNVTQATNDFWNIQRDTKLLIHGLIRSH